MHIRTRLTGALAALLIIAAIAIGSSQPATAAAVTVRQGETVVVGSASNTSQFTVSPPQAGTVSNPNWVGNATFTASATFVGPARVCLAGGACVDVIVIGPRADVGATFTPRLAPGPCLQIVSGGTIGFGDVTVGATTTAATGTAVSNCSSGLDVDIFGSITQATSGTGPGAVVWEPVQTTPTPNQFRYRLQNSGDNVDRVLDNDSSVFVQRLPNSFTRTFDHTLTIGAGSTTGLNTAFSATIVLTATTAAP